MSDTSPLVLTDIRRVPKSTGSRARQEVVSICLRIPQALIDRLDSAALATYRSRNKEAEARLWASFEGESIDEHGVIVRCAQPSSK